jgi:hypothetical protein
VFWWLERTQAKFVRESAIGIVAASAVLLLDTNFGLCCHILLILFAFVLGQLVLDQTFRLLWLFQLMEDNSLIPV